MPGKIMLLLFCYNAAILRLSFSKLLYRWAYPRKLSDLVIPDCRCKIWQILS